MEYAKIAGLLERYWEGETTLTEEQQLKQYFQSGHVDARFQEVAPLFQTLSAAQQITAPASLGASIQPVAMQVSYSKNWLRIAAAAVVVGVLSTTYWFLTSKPQDINQVVQTETPKLVVPTIEQPKTPENTKDLSVTAPVEPTKRIKTFKKRYKKQIVPMDAPAQPQQIVTDDQEEYTEAETQQALEELRAALAILSAKMNKGKQDIAKPLSKVDFEQYIN
ncbi:MAG: hypothetical protein RIR11_2204 [Bacteroidota bacterium]|jgi:hypothetical protein